MAYATLTELADYLGVLESDLPDDANRLLERASELIDYYTLGRIEAGETASEATVRQYEWWSQFDEFNTQQFFSSIQIGPFQASNAEQKGQSGPPELAPRARQLLLLAGYLNRGVDAR
jgi:hypothetical protein